jgi:hypothetical protein
LSCMQNLFAYGDLGFCPGHRPAKLNNRFNGAGISID